MAEISASIPKPGLMLPEPMAWRLHGDRVAYIAYCIYKDGLRLKVGA
ncbi:hypothetical protein [Desulfoprunum benzoelyticum]|nr:hypothetical protein [Desulfoprunum benzoelyticum]